MFWKKNPEKERIKERIKIAERAIETTGCELAAWGDTNLCVSYKNEIRKTTVINVLKGLGWNFTPEPGDEEALLLSFSLEPPTTSPQ